MENLKETKNPDDLMLDGILTTRLCCENDGKVRSITFKDKSGKILEIKAGYYGGELNIYTNIKQEQEKENEEDD